MTKPAAPRPRSEDTRPCLDARGWQLALVGTNINPETFLATDYLNHFNEVIMILDLAADMPDCLEDIVDWAPRSYEDHFVHSHFPHKDLALSAYRNAPAERCDALENVVRDLDGLILHTIKDATSQTPEMTAGTVSAAAAELRRLICKASAIINGAPLDPLAEPSRTETSDSSMSQDAVDSLFD